MNLLNKRRATRAKKAIESEYRDMDFMDNLTDFLTDLHHLCDKNKIDFDSAWKIAYRHYLEEQNDNRKGM